MANKYYYLVASLPYLKLEEVPPLSKESFFQECEKWLSSTDLLALKKLDIDDFTMQPHDSHVVEEWKQFDYRLRQELAHLRKARKTSLQEKRSLLTQAIMAEQTPLLMEKALARKRWEFIDEIELGHHFDFNLLQLYYLKLQLVERTALFKTEEGKNVFEHLCEVKYE